MCKKLETIQVVNSFRIFVDLQSLDMYSVPSSFLCDYSIRFVLSETNNEDMEGFNDIWANILNGDIINNAGENNGSCKLFAFAMHQEFTKEETLLCFGEHYQTVLEDKNGTSHQNIRNFMQTGFKGLSFENEALTLKK